VSGGDDWQVGDLALCIKLGPWRDVIGPKCGEVRAVRGVGRDPIGVGLWLEGYPGKLRSDGFSASRFRKITPPKADEFDREVIDLMIGKPVPVEA